MSPDSAEHDNGLAREEVHTCGGVASTSCG
jgi:hypothetical protein